MVDYSYAEYVKHYDHREADGRYNWRYRQVMRESDKRMMALLDAKAAGRRSVKLVDLGCGNGNFLFHLKQKYPHWTLHGKDLAVNLIAECQADPSLAGIHFDVADLTVPPSTLEAETYDFVILIAVLQVLPPDAFQKALTSIARYLKPGGWLINFDGYHPFIEQELIRVEITADTIRPDFPTMSYYYPSRAKAAEWCLKAGFNQVEFEDFYMPFDLTRPTGNPAASHTELIADGRRFSMLGVIAQPWTFLKSCK